jgi:hypothetical protein
MLMLRLVHRIVRQYLPDVVIRYCEMPPGLMGASSYMDVPIMLIATGLEPAERAHTILHELAHLLFDRETRRPLGTCGATTGARAAPIALRRRCSRSRRPHDPPHHPARNGRKERTMSPWIERWNDTIADAPELPGVWRRRQGGFHIRGRATDPRTGRLREVNRALPECRRATKAAAELEAALDAIRKSDAEVSGGELPRFGTYAADLFERKVAAGDIASAAGREKWSAILGKHLVPTFGDCFLDKISASDIERWKVAVLKDEYAPTTVNTMLSVLKAIYAAACKEYRKRLDDPTEGVAPCNLKAHRTYTDEAPNALSAENVGRFLDEVRMRWPEHYAMIYLGMITGWRPSMLRPLRRKGPHADIDWITGTLKARRSHTVGNETMAGTKNGESWAVKLPAEALSVLKWHVDRLERENERRRQRSPENAAAMDASDLLFPAEPNGRNRGGGFRTKSALDAAFKDAGERIGLGYRVTPRALRRSFQDLCREAGVGGVLARGICGHKTPEMTARYSTVALDETEAAIGRIIDFAAAKRARAETPPAPPPERTDLHSSAPSNESEAREASGMSQR